MNVRKHKGSRALALFLALTMVMMYSVTMMVFAEDVGELTPQPQRGSISLEKKVDSVDTKTVNFLDTEVTYTFVVRNTGNKNLTNVVLSDNKIGMPNITIGALAAGASTTCSITVNLSSVESTKWHEHDGDLELRNTGTVSGDYTWGQGFDTCSDTDGATVKYVPALTFEKYFDNGRLRDTDLHTVNFKDADVEYTFKVRNNLGTGLTNLLITDPKLAAIINIPTLNAHSTYTTTAAFDLGTLAGSDWINNEFVNTATVEAPYMRGDDSMTLSAIDTATVKYEPALTLEKTVDKNKVNFKDEEVEYSFKITNNLNDDLDNIVLTDPLIGATIIVGGIDGGKHKHLSRTFNLSGAAWNANEFTNTATVEAPYMRGDDLVTLSAVDTAKVTYVPPMTLEKSVEPSTVFDKDGVVEYTFIITNNMGEPVGTSSPVGEKSLKNVSLYDPLIGVSITGITIAKGHNYTLKVAFGLDSLNDGAWDGLNFVNTAIATGCVEREVDREDDRVTPSDVQIDCIVECITLQAIDSATVTFDPTTVTILKDVPNVDDSTEPFDVTIYKTVPVVPEDDSNIAEQDVVTTLVAIEVVQISEMDSHVFEVTESGMYTFVETPKAGYTTSDASFEITVEVINGIDQTVTFVNTKDSTTITTDRTTRRTSPNPTPVIPEPEVPLAEIPAEMPVITDQPVPLADVVPQTSDEGNIWLLLALMLGSGAGITALGRRKETAGK